MDQEEEGDNAHRPPNAFILYSQAMRSSVRQDNPSLSNTEVSRLLGKMWKEVPADQKQIYKQRAASAQEIFKREHPDYTYRKARRKRALNELLTKSAQGFPMPGYPGGDPQFAAMMSAGANPYAYMQMYAQQQGQMMPGVAQGQPGIQGVPMMTSAQGQLPAQGYANMAGFQGIDPSAGVPSSFYQGFPQK
jgi:transcription factor SOX7/8/10/18 (SOX group E/F)